MFFTIITLVKNSMPYLKKNISSVNNQKFKNFEHLMIYSNSKDDSYKTIKKNLNKRRRLIIFNTANVYKAINHAISKSKGDYLMLLHSDDFFYNDEILKKLNYHLNFHKSDVAYGNILFVNRKNSSKKIRYWIPGNFRNYKIYFGWTPPHTSLVIKKKIFKFTGFYSEKYKISSDYDFIIRLFLRKKLKILYLNKFFIFMRYGGLSTKFSKTYAKIKEDITICLKHFTLFGPFVYILKIIRKIPQFITFKT